MSAFGIDSVQAGSINSAFGSWEIRATDGTGSVRWELIDEDGVVYNSGTVSSLTVTAHPFKTGYFQFRAEAQVEVPFSVPVNSLGTKYQIKWVLLKDGVEHYVFDTFRVLPSEFDRFGVVDLIDLQTATVRLAMRLGDVDSLHSCVVKVFTNNTEVLSQTIAGLPISGSDGYTYYYDWTPSTSDIVIGPSLNPYTVLFQYQVLDTDPVATQYGNLWIVNPTILDAQRNIEQFLNASYQDAGLQPFAQFDGPTLMSYLRKGMDQFNGVVRPTNFTMTNAAGPVRHFWLGYSMVMACRSQQLAEGMRAFNFAGQSISLDVDRTQYWEQMASSLAGDLDQQVKPFKDMLNKYGIFGGDGSIISPTLGSIGAIGIRLSTLTPLRTGGFRYPGFYF